jgi:hypothetical protein
MRHTSIDSLQPFQFSWEVPETGYQCKQAYRDNDAKPESEQMLVEHAPDGVSRRVRRHRTLREETALFREFAKVDLTPEGVIAFANRYGTLGGNVRQPIKIGSSRAKQHGFNFGEPLATWYTEISEVRRLLPLFDPDGKPEIIFETHTESITALWPDGWGVVAFRATEPDTYERLKDKPTEIMRHYLKTQINRKLLDHKSTGRLLEYNGALRLFIVPESLIAAIWLQFACAIDGNRKYRSCKNCKKWFEVGRAGRRADAETCSDSCRAAFTYKRKKAKTTRRGRKHGKR